MRRQRKAGHRHGKLKRAQAGNTQGTTQECTCAQAQVREQTNELQDRLTATGFPVQAPCNWGNQKELGTNKWRKKKRGKIDAKGHVKAKEKVARLRPPVTLARRATLACSWCTRSEPRSGTPQQAHACTKFHHSFPSFSTVDEELNSGACFTPRRAQRVKLDDFFGSRKTVFLLIGELHPISCQTLGRHHHVE